MIATFLNTVVVGEWVHTIVSGGQQRCLVISIEGTKIELQYIRQRAFEKDTIEEIVRSIDDIFLIE